MNTAAASSTVTIYDSVQDSPHVVAVIDSSIVQSKGYGVRCPGGIIVVIAGGSPDVTIGYV